MRKPGPEDDSGFTHVTQLPIAEPGFGSGGQVRAASARGWIWWLLGEGRGPDILSSVIFAIDLSAT